MPPLIVIMQAADLIRPAILLDAASGSRLRLDPQDFDTVTKKWAPSGRTCGRFEALTATGARLVGGWVTDSNSVLRFELIVRSPADPGFGASPDGPGYQHATGKVYVGSSAVDCDSPTS